MEKCNLSATVFLVFLLTVFKCVYCAGVCVAGAAGGEDGDLWAGAAEGSDRGVGQSTGGQFFD